MDDIVTDPIADGNGWICVTETDRQPTWAVLEPNSVLNPAHAPGGLLPVYDRNRMCARRLG